MTQIMRLLHPQTGLELLPLQSTRTDINPANAERDFREQHQFYDDSAPSVVGARGDFLTPRIRTLRRAEVYRRRR